MYLCRLVLNPANRLVRRDLADCQELHRRILSTFGQRPDPASADGARAQFGLLYRLEDDERGGPPRLYVQSVLEPDWSRLPAGYLAEPAACKSVSEAYARIENSMVLRFRLRANPTKKILTQAGPEGERNNGKRVQLRSEQELVDWLQRKAESGGFELLTLEGAPHVPDVRILPEARVVGSSRPRDQRLTFGAVFFEGRLRVSDADRFRETLASGIGSGKAYGMGLLSVAPVMPG